MASPAFEELVDTFSFLDDWEDRYRQIIELGRTLPPLDAAFKVPALRVQGCASQVWLRPMPQGRLYNFQGESDAQIVHGLIAVLHALYADVAINEVKDIDAVAELSRLGLHQHLSAQRSNGLRAMVQRIQETAAV
jgi:cysteine desulfuration protein SufE